MFWAGTACPGRFAAQLAEYNQLDAIVNPARCVRPAPHGCLRQPPGAPGAGIGPALADAPEETRQVPGDRPLRCAACRAVVTHERERIPVAGSHRHVFANPFGFVFELGCFAAAPGCVCIGPASAAYTWFAGTVWRQAVCGACGLHLGWRYEQAAEKIFFGLILARLLRERAGGPEAN